MKAEHRQEFVKKALLGLWAMLTLILVIALGLVVYNLMQQGQSPFPVPPARALSEVQAMEAQLASETLRETPLYFASEDGRLLVPETRRLSLGDDSLANFHTALDALIKGPEGVLTPVVPPTTRVHGLFLMDSGELIVDVSMEAVSGLRKQPSVSSEMLFLQGILHTLTASELLGTDTASVARVRILIEGASAEESFQDAHCNWANPFERDTRWLASSQSTGP